VIRRQNKVIKPTIMRSNSIKKPQQHNLNRETVIGVIEKLQKDTAIPNKPHMLKELKSTVQWLFDSVDQNQATRIMNEKTFLEELNRLDRFK
jgi:hypothetical protein